MRWPCVTDMKHMRKIMLALDTTNSDEIDTVGRLGLTNIYILDTP